MEASLVEHERERERDRERQRELFQETMSIRGERARENCIRSEREFSFVS